MKKFLTSFAVALVLSMPVNAQDTSTTASVNSVVDSNSSVSDTRRQRFVKRASDRMASKKSSTDSEMSDDGDNNIRKMGRRGMRERSQEMIGSKDVGGNDDNSQTSESGMGKWRDKYNNASPKQQERMQHRHEVMQNLSPEQKAAVKQEIARHRQAMKQFGFGDSDLPPAPQENDSFGQ